ncbi:MATE family efflux transporter [Dongia deserti]|uniref:MATE family efflux transporter n=1 Tax=Dongia deserti TaxID=2268030 RepID=UPI000E64F5A5|nr:MATE family efflux transporter [Dongia deserti]
MKRKSFPPGEQSATQVPLAPADNGNGNSLPHHLNRTVRLALPVMLSRAGMVVMLTVDTMIVGHLAFAKQQQLAALGAAIIPVGVLQTAAIGLLIGIIVRTAQLEGAGRPQACGEVWRLGLMLGLLLGGMYTLLFAYGPAILELLGQPPEVAEGGGAVLRIFGWGMPGMLVFIACAHFLEGINRPVPPMLLMLVGNILNAILAYGLGTGAFGLPASGVMGVALATTIVRWGLGIGGVLLVLLTIDRHRYGITLRHVEGWSGLVALLRLGIPLAAAIGLETACFNMIVNMSGWLGLVSLATMHATVNYTSFVYMLTIGVATAAAVRVGNAVGSGDWRAAQRAGWIAVGLAGALMLIAGLLTVLFAEEAAAILTDDPDVLAMLVPVLAGVVSFLVVVDAVQGVLMGALRGCADTLIPTIIYGVSFWIIGVPAGYWWGYHHGLGPNALTWSLLAALAAASAALAWRFQHLTRQKAR